jgi:hypothetical protein
MVTEVDDAGRDRHEPEPITGGGGEPLPAAADLVFRTCVVALWSDGSMAAAERDHLSHLIDSVATTGPERDQLRRLALHDVNRHQVLAEIEHLSDEDRRDLFDRCTRLLTSDRRVCRGELRFLSELRRRCGIGAWQFERLRWRLTWRRRVAVAGGLGVLLVLAILPWGPPEETGNPPHEVTVHREVFLAPIPLERPQLAAEALYDRVRRSVVTVHVRVDGSQHGNGSGTVIATDGVGQLYVLTNRHVIYHELPATSELELMVEVESGVRLPATLDFYSRTWDLALLLVPRISGWASPVPLLSRDQLRVGQRVYAVGSPMGLDHSFTSGLISAIRDAYIQTDATVHSGSSGGPLFDDRGLMVGVVTTTHLHKDLSFALCADAVFDMLSERASGAGGTAAPRPLS